MMRVKLIMASVLAVSMVGVPAAYAQGAANADADTTCSEFVSMDAAAQADLVAKLGTSTGGSSSSMSAGAGANSSSDSSASANNAAPDSGSEAGSLGSSEGGSMDAAAVLAACQNDPNLTVGEAMSSGTSQ
jgi:hypothetical protein